MDSDLQRLANLDFVPSMSLLLHRGVGNGALMYSIGVVSPAVFPVGTVIPGPALAARDYLGNSVTLLGLADLGRLAPRPAIE
jgi:hypothetical protein